MPRALKWSFGILIFLCLVAAFTLRVCHEMDFSDSAYTNLAEAHSAGAAQKGWLPDFLPPSTRDIRLRDNVSTNQLWMSFKMDSDDTQALFEHCMKVSRNEIRPPEEPGVGWWPDSLVGRWHDGTISFVGGAEFQYLKCSRRAGAPPHSSYDGWLAVNPRSGAAYYWENVR
jgi:hypothetical protein